MLPPLQARAAGGDKAKDRPYIIYDAVNNALWLRWPKDSGGRCRRLLLAAWDAALWLCQGSHVWGGLCGGGSVTWWALLRCCLLGRACTAQTYLACCHVVPMQLLRPKPR